MTRLFLASTSEDWESRVRKAFDGELDAELRRPWHESSLLGSPQAALNEVTHEDPWVVAIGPGLPEENALELARTIDEERPDICVVLVATPTPQLWQTAVRAGVRDIVAPDAPLAEIRETIERSLDTAARRREHLVAETTSSGPSSKVIAIVSPKGGAGKTAIATNLAVGLASQAPNQVVIVDLDLQFGDVGNALRLSPEFTMTDVARLPGNLDATALKAYLTPHPAGLYVLSAPDSPADADDVTPQNVSAVLELLSSMFPFVVVDTPAGLDEVTLTAMEASTDIILVCATDVASARSVRKELEAFDLLGLTTQRRHFALNRADARVGLSVQDIEGTVGMEVSVSIPSSRAVPLSMNQGSPLLESQQKSPVSRAMYELVNRFAGMPQPAEPAPTAQAGNAGLLRRWKETR